MRKKKLEKKNEKVLRLNRFLARKDVLAGICILEDVSLFFIVQYLLNICLNLPLWFETQNPKVCFGLKNLFPVPERVESFKGLGTCRCHGGMESYNHISDPYVSFREKL